jgi:hypothetical protein
VCGRCAEDEKISPADGCLTSGDAAFYLLVERSRKKVACWAAHAVGVTTMRGKVL